MLQIVQGLHHGAREFLYYGRREVRTGRALVEVSVRRPLPGPSSPADPRFDCERLDDVTQAHRSSGDHQRRNLVVIQSLNQLDAHRWVCHVQVVDERHLLAGRIRRGSRIQDFIDGCAYFGDLSKIVLGPVTCSNKPIDGGGESQSETIAVRLADPYVVSIVLTLAKRPSSVTSSRTASI